jgi:hypothetical protein
VPEPLAAQLDALAVAVSALLVCAQRCGSVVVITNAETNWVQLSCQKFMPRLWPTVSALRVVSARSTFEALHPDSPSDWKVQAFFQEICTAYSGTRPNDRKNILSFGDSVHERAAVHRVTSNMGPHTRTKSIKFVERPSVEQLKRQVDLVASCFEEICRHDDHLDLMLTIQLIYQPDPVRRRRAPGPRVFPGGARGLSPPPASSPCPPTITHAGRRRRRRRRRCCRRRVRGCGRAAAAGAGAAACAGRRGGQRGRRRRGGERGPGHAARHAAAGHRGRRLCRHRRARGRGRGRRRALSAPTAPTSRLLLRLSPTTTFAPRHVNRVCPPSSARHFVSRRGLA